MRILVVEDDREAASYLTRGLKESGHIVDHAPDGQDGLFQMRHNVYDRAGQPCGRCGTPIVKTVLAQRGTHLCPQCQVLRDRSRQ